MSEAKYKTKYGQELKVLIPGQMLQKLPIVPAKVKQGNNSKLFKMKSDKLFNICINQKKLLKNV